MSLTPSFSAVCLQSDVGDSDLDMEGADLDDDDDDDDESDEDIEPGDIVMGTGGAHRNPRRKKQEPEDSDNDF